MSTPTRLIKAVVKRLERLERIRGLLAEHWDATGDRRHAVRRDDVVKVVAKAVDEDERSNKLRAAVLLLGRQLGWKPVRCGNRRLFACVKSKALEPAAAVLASKELRRRL